MVPAGRAPVRVHVRDKPEEDKPAKEEMNSYIGTVLVTTNVQTRDNRQQEYHRTPYIILPVHRILLKKVAANSSTELFCNFS